MRLMRFLLAALCLAAGALVGALNRDPVAIRFGAYELDSTVGVALIGALLVGALIGGAAVALGALRSPSTSRIQGRLMSRPKA